MLKIYFFFFFSSRRRHTRSLRDWSSDVCSSDLREQRDLVVVEVPADDPPARVEVPHLAERQREVLAGSGERGERRMMRADDGEGAYHRVASVDVAGADDSDAGRGADPPSQEVVPELLGRLECSVLRVISPGDAVGVLLGHGHEVPLVEGLVTSAVVLDVPGFHDSSFAALAAADEFMVAAAACANRSLAFPRPFRILAVTRGIRT